jgi:hypothetical protein
MVRTIRSTLIPSDSSKFIYCTFIECLLVDFFSQTYSKIETIEFKDVISELADCQVYVDLFEIGEVLALNKSFGNSHFEFDVEISLLNRIYKSPRLFSTEELAKLLAGFTPSALEIKGSSNFSHLLIILERSLRTEARQLLSFEDSFKSQPNRSQEMSSKRSLLSLNLGSNSSRSVKVNSPKNNDDNLFVRNVYIHVFIFF